MSDLMISPGRYVSGYGNADEIGKYIKKLGKNVIVFYNNDVKKVYDDVIKSCEEKEIMITGLPFDGHCSYTEINKFVEEIRERNCDVIIGIGGGRVIDTAKAAGFISGIKIVTFPTIAATCAAWSSHSAVYTEDGIAFEYLSIDKNPDLCFVDKKIIVEAPRRYLIAGIADTIAKWIETDAFTRNIEMKSTETELAISLARRSFEDIEKYAEKALIGTINKTLTKELDIIINHIIITAGLVGGIGGESCRAVAAHAINNGLTVFPENYWKNLHGEAVAFGNIVQMVLDKKDGMEIEKLVHMYRTLEIPATLDELGFIDTDEELEKIVEKTLVPSETIHNLSYKVDKNMLKAAIIEANKIGRTVL